MCPRRTLRQPNWDPKASPLPSMLPAVRHPGLAAPSLIPDQAALGGTGIRTPAARGELDSVFEARASGRG
ncbi:hypothetical protein EYF80_028057 [Liparis tanakae]|uniref:Uncharacterized protein n=1 Tax=Liparis tanakae TaxID=230148 RepID=A0A4Z2H8V9_9TELE|nr:hypothetical protein EYF80_028057 [Liparis tanakae]